MFILTRIIFSVIFYLILILLRTSQTAKCVEIYTANDRAPKDLYKACDG